MQIEHAGSRTSDAAQTRTWPADGVTIELLAGHERLSAAADVINRVFGDVLPVDILVGLQLAGSYLGGAYRHGELIGCAVGFGEVGPSGPQPVLHSHVAAVLPQARGLRVGRALKWHQRAWALERGFGAIHWTFDPLVRRNCHLNLNLLGADAVRYLPNLYGTIGDALNGNQQTDRLLLSWDLTSDRVAALAAGSPPADPDVADASVLLTADESGEPVDADAPGTGTDRFLIATPADIESLVATRPATAERWRTAQRTVLKPLVDNGYRVSGVTRDGFLIVTGPAASGPAASGPAASGSPGSAPTQVPATSPGTASPGTAPPGTASPATEENE